MTPQPANAPSPDVQRFRLPDLGEGLTDAELTTWLVSVGDTVELNQNLCEVETAKALVELPSPFAGTVVSLLVQEGETALVGDPLIEIAADASGTGILVGTGPLAHRPSRIRRADYLPQPAAPAASTAQRRTDAKPAARRLARELGVDLTTLTGTGANGVVTSTDVRAAAPGRGLAENAARRETRTPVRGVRKAMAESVTLSARTIPQVTVFLTVDVSESMRLLRELREDDAFHEIPLTPLTVTALSLLRALRDHPELNSSWDDAAHEVIARNYVNLGIAVASPRGLIVPNIKDADRLRLAALARAIGELAAAARSSTTAPEDLAGGTISITNVGIFGVDAGTPILNPGEAAILCLGAVRARPWVWEGAVAIREVATLGLTFDHRLADGQQASTFLAAVGAGLEHPLRLLA